MFEVGKTYVIKVDELNNIVENYNCKVIEYDNEVGLIKIQQDKYTKIINPRSARFIEARIQE